MDQLSHSDRERTIATAVLAAMTSGSLPTGSDDTSVLPFKGRPNPGAISKMAIERVNQMEPAAPLADRPVVHRVWMSWFAASTAKTEFGRTSALREAADALALLQDATLCQRLLREQLAESSAALRGEYEAIIAAHPVVGAMQLELDEQDLAADDEPIGGGSPLTLAADVEKAVRRIEAASPGPIVLPNSIATKSGHFVRPNRLLPTARTIIGLSVAATLVIGFVFWRQYQSHEDGTSQVAQVTPTKIPSGMQNGNGVVVPKVAPSPTKDDAPPILGSNEPDTMTFNELFWLHTDIVPLPPSPKNDPGVKIISSFLTRRSRSREFDKAAELDCLDKLNEAELTYGVNAPATATCLNALAKLYLKYERYSVAEPYLVRLLKLQEAELGSNHSDVVTCLEGLAESYFQQEEYDSAKPLYKRLLKLCDTDPNLNLDRGTCLENVAKVDFWSGDYTEAALRFQRVLEIREAALGARDPEIATCLDNLGMSRLGERNLAAAQPLLERALEIREIAFGRNHPLTAASLNSLAMLSCAKQDFPTAQELLQRVVNIAASNFGADDEFTANCLDNLAKLQFMQANYSEAERLFRLVWRIRSDVFGPGDSNTLNAKMNFERAARMRKNE